MDGLAVFEGVPEVVGALEVAFGHLLAVESVREGDCRGFKLDFLLDERRRRPGLATRGEPLSPRPRAKEGDRFASRTSRGPWNTFGDHMEALIVFKNGWIS